MSKMQKKLKKLLSPKVMRRYRRNTKYASDMSMINGGKYKKRTVASIKRDLSFSMSNDLPI